MSARMVAFHTFGCKVNQYETEELRNLLRSGGLEAAPAQKAADIYVINSCTVTSDADRSCRQLIRKLLHERPQARVMVTGCYAERARSELQALSSRVEVFGRLEKPRMAAALRAVAPAICRPGPSRPSLTSGARPTTCRADETGRTRMFIKVQDGCDGACTYCIVPSVRPVMSCRPPDGVLEEARRLVAQGCREIVLTGVRLGRYEWRDDAAVWDLARLVRRLVELPGDFRIRLSSIEITEMSEPLLELAASNPKLCPFFHIPLQSGDNQTLKRMGRWYTADRYRSMIREIRRRIPEAALSTDVIVGFPGEGEEPFHNTVRLLTEEEFSRLHVFRYSQRPGTPAERLGSPVDPRIKSRRLRALLEIDQTLRRRYASRFLRRPVRVLQESHGWGYSEHYVRVQSRTPLPEGEFHTLQPLEVGSDAVLLA